MKPNGEKSTMLLLQYAAARWPALVECREAVADADAVADEQLRLRFFPVVASWTGNPPERALWRDLVTAALDGKDVISGPDGRLVRASTVRLVAYELYMRSDKSGVVKKFSECDLAAVLKLHKRTVHAALSILRRLRIARPERFSRRRPCYWRMNLGGMDWPAVRERAKQERERARLLDWVDGRGTDGRPDAAELAAADRLRGLRRILGDEDELEILKARYGPEWINARRAELRKLEASDPGA